VLLQKLILPHLFNTPLAFYGTPSFTTLFTKARHLPQSWARLFHSTRSHSIYNVRFSIIPHLCPGLPSGLFPSNFTAEVPCVFLFSRTCAIRLTHHILLDLVTLMKQQKSWSSSSRNFAHSPCNILPLRRPNIFLSTQSRTPPAYCLPLTWKTHLHSPTKQDARLQLCTF